MKLEAEACFKRAAVSSFNVNTGLSAEQIHRAATNELVQASISVTTYVIHR
jgi:hypothetical protein